MLAPVAQAHSDLAATEPAAGARLAEAPGWVALRFAGALESDASDVRVTDGNGTRVDVGDLRVSGGERPVLNVSLREGLGEDGYLVRWSILSDDGHPNSGRFTFTVGNATALDASDAGPAIDPAAASGRALSYIGLAMALGAAAWLWLVRAPVGGFARPASKALALGALLHLVGVALLLKATADSIGVGMSALADSRVGAMLILRLGAGAAALLFAGLALVPRNPSRLGGPVAVAFLLLAAFASAAIGHAAGEGGVPGLVVDAMHLVASATWAGGLILLVVALALATRRGLPAEDVRRIGLRFGTVALACVILLVLSGLAATFVILGQSALLDPLHLTDSLYGRLLLAKVGLAGAMVAVAGVNRFVFLGPANSGAAPAAGGLRHRLARLGPDGTVRGLRRAVAVEAVLGLVVLALAGALTATSPSGHEGHDAAGGHVHPGAAAAAAGDPSAGHLHEPSASLISQAWHGQPMIGSSLLAPLHEGHEGGGAFDAYNLTIGGVVLVVLVLVGFGIYKLVQRRRGEE